MPDGEIAGPIPAVGERRRGRRGVLEITFHHRIAAKHHLAQGRSIARQSRSGLGIADLKVRERRHRHALSRHALRTLSRGKRVPFALPGAKRCRPVRFGQAIKMRHAKTHCFHRLDHRGRRRRAARGDVYAMVEAHFHVIWRMD